jgi:hypothetical protein
MTDQNATAIAVQLFDANLFDIVGPIHVNYTSSSITGTPRVSYQDAELDLSFEGDEITRIQTQLGEVVTVTLENSVDAFIRTFTLIVPTIRLTHGGETEFDTLGIETTDGQMRSSFDQEQRGPCRPTGSISSTEVHNRPNFETGPQLQKSLALQIVHTIRCTAEPAACISFEIDAWN